MPTFNAIEEVLAQFPFLAELGDEIYRVLTQGIRDNEPIDVIIQNVRDTSTYKQRFAGLEVRRREGLPAMTEAEYLSTELGYKNQIREFNVAGTLGLTTEEAFREFAAEMIGVDVSVQELNARLDRATGLARDASDTVQQAFIDFYGAPVSEDALVAYFLDPELGLNVIEDQLASATIGAEALSRGLQINRTRAEILRREGVTADLARQGYADIAREQPVLSRLAQIHNTTPLSQQELEEFFFHEDADVAARRNRTFSQALSEFQSGGAAQRSRTGGLQELVDRNRSV
jgi:hypothetical protein